MVPRFARGSSILTLLLVAACGNAEEKQSSDPHSDESAITRTSQVEADEEAPLKISETDVAEAAPGSSGTAPDPKGHGIGLAATVDPRQNKEATASGQSQTVVAKRPLETPRGFAICSACHSAQIGEHGVGPSLAGVYGTKAGSKSFAYSSAMTASNISWDETALDEFLLAPAKRVPGTTMAFAGVRDQQARQEIIEYLKSL